MRALDHALSVLERLQAIVLRRGETQTHEDIYYKRHIAVGIPSMYGSYHEERFDAMGLTFSHRRKPCAATFRHDRRAGHRRAS